MEKIIVDYLGITTTTKANQTTERLQSFKCNMPTFGQLLNNYKRALRKFATYHFHVMKLWF